MNVSYGARFAERVGDTVYVTARCNLEIVDQKEALPPAVTIHAHFEIPYQLPKGFEVDETMLQAFAESEGMYNAWSYFREFVQSSSTRMTLPPIAIPTLDVRETRQEKKPKKPLQKKKKKQKKQRSDA